jgi:hypothetical protein
MESLQQGLQEYYSFWKNKDTLDKNTTRIFLVLSGPGLGKSRLLEELHQLAYDAIPDQNPELKNLLKSALTFKVCFENGSPYTDEDSGDSSEIVGDRMMYLFSDETSFLDFRLRYRKQHFTIIEALNHISNSNQNRAVFLLIDGIQQVGDKLMDVVRSVCSHMTKYTKATKLFLIPVFSATIYDPFKKPLNWKSPQVRVFLYPHLINGHQIIQHHLPWVRTLVDDTGGHGRALEALLATLRSWHVDESFDTNRESDPNFFSSILSDFRHNLRMSYQNWNNPLLAPVLKCIVARKPFSSAIDEVMPGLSVDNVLNFGLITWSEGLCFLRDSGFI